MSFCTMKETMAGYLFCCILVTFTSCSNPKDDKKEHEFSQEEIRSLSETMGYLLMESLQAQHLKMDIDSLIKGINGAKSGGVPPLSKDAYYQLLSKYKSSLIKIQGAENLKIADDFLAENSQKEGVASIDNGKVQYIVLSAGSGPAVRESDTPLVNYEGKLIDGTVFDSTKTRGSPVLLPLQGTISGFKDAVIGMKEGEKRRIFIHPDHGFGTKGSLPPNSLLIFELEIVNAEGSHGQNALGGQERANERMGTGREDAGAGEDREAGLRWLKKIREAIF